jgi:[ribosomal protein S5]-alanine N-acetyltransferase
MQHSNRDVACHSVQSHTAQLPSIVVDVALSYPDPPLSDDVVVIRRWTKSDLGCIEEASREGRIPEGTTVPAKYTAAEGRAWIERQWGRATEGTGLSQAIADRGSNEALGAVVLMARRPGTVEIGYWLVERARGRGLGSRAVGLVARWAVQDAGLARVEALVEPENIASQRVLEKGGFRREGHLRSYLVFEQRRADALVYSLLPSDLS